MIYSNEIKRKKNKYTLSNVSTKIIKDKRLTYLIQSLRINYKTFLLLFVVLIILSKKNYITCFITFFILMLLSYFTHYFYHCEIFYPMNVIHIYHHENNNFFSHFIQLILEFGTSCFILCIHYLFGIPIFLNEWIIIFFYIFYTTIHNVNYGFFHINNIHELHHKMLNKNFGPDICDIIFHTKHDIQNDIENIDHYIINIVVVFIFIYYLKILCEKEENKKIFRKIFIGTYLFFSILLLITTIYFFQCNPNNINKKYYKLIHKIRKIIQSNDKKKWKKLYRIIIVKNNYLKKKKGRKKIKTKKINGKDEK